jgi:hypothetical protein
VPTVLGQMMTDPDLAKAKPAADAKTKRLKRGIVALIEASAGTA